MTIAPPWSRQTGGRALGGNDVLEEAVAWQRSGHDVAMATVISTWGSAPRPVGSQLCVDQNGLFSGSVSGGCIEGAVVSEALAVLSSRVPRLIEFHVSNTMAWEVGLACGGRIELFVEPVAAKRHALRLLSETRSGGRPAVLITELPGGAHALLIGNDRCGPLTVDDAVVAAAHQAVSADQCRILVTEQGRLFLHVFNPAPRLIIVGAVHIAEPLSRMATSAGYRVILVDPRRGFAAREQFQGYSVMSAWPDQAMEQLALDERAAVVTLTHDPKLDDAALRVALRSQAFYIGCLGSRKTHAARLVRLRAMGLGDDELARVHGPVGLPIGARTPSEIAISILAEMTQVRRGEAAP